MNKKLSSLLICPHCRKNIFQRGQKFYCNFCKQSYPTVSDIPVFMKSSEYSNHIDKQIRYFNSEIFNCKDKYICEKWQQTYADFFINTVGLVKDKIFLDIGTGSGYMAIELAKRGAFVIALDVTFQNLIRLKSIAEKEHISAKILPICCSAETLPFASNIFDGIMMNAILEHIEQERELIGQINRVSVKNGFVMTTVPILYRFLFPLFIPLNMIHDKRIGHLRRYSLEILQSKFSSWKICKVRYTGHVEKVIKVIINMIFGHVFDEKEIENTDMIRSQSRLFASNISVIFQKT